MSGGARGGRRGVAQRSARTLLVCAAMNRPRSLRPLGQVALFALAACATDVAEEEDDGLASSQSLSSSNLVGHWRFDETGGTIAEDAAGRDHDGTLKNGPTRAAGKHGGALRFDGANDFVDVGDVLDMKAGQDFTVSAWINTTNVVPNNGDSQRIVSKQAPGGSLYFLRLKTDGRPSFGVRSGYTNGGEQLGRGSVADGRWHLVTGMRKGATISLYVDGALHGSMTATSSDLSNAARLLIGAYTPTEQHFRGSIDDVRIYTRALSGSEVAELYGEQVTTPPAPPPTRGPRVFITTDIGGSDNDDDQSMVHALLYADYLRIEGISRTYTADDPTNVGDRGDILDPIAAYEADYAKLKTWGPYPTPAALRAISYQGTTKPGVTGATIASRAIVTAAKRGDASDPLYLLAWGGVGDIAQALKDDPSIAPRVRLYTIGHQEAKADQYMDATWRGKVWWLESLTTFRGMYATSAYNRPLTGRESIWLTASKQPKGALGKYMDDLSHGLYQQGIKPEDQGYGIKMGDTPSILFLLDPEQNRNDPTRGGWGGRYRRTADQYWTDLTNEAIGRWPGAKTVADHRSEFLADFARRFDRALAAKP